MNPGIIFLLCWGLPVITHALCRVYLTPVNQVVEVRTIHREMKEIRKLRYEIKAEDHSMRGLRKLSKEAAEHYHKHTVYELVEMLANDLRKENDVVRVIKTERPWDRFDHYSLEIMILPPIKR
jgi:hypothetical protein